jgi:hypothetical protein
VVRVECAPLQKRASANFVQMHRSDIYNYFPNVPFEEVVATIAAFGAEAAVSRASLLGLRQIRIHFVEVMRFAFAGKSVFSS